MGFSLIELMITLSICAMMAAMTYPSYTHYQAQANRTQAEAVLLDMADLLEQYYGTLNTYVGATLKKIHWINHHPQLPYQFKISELSDQHYLLQAIPVLAQASRDSCGTLGLTETNERFSAQVRNCW